uniref:Cytochrome P450 n=1 Tax=Plectus sambesii TaxID=2011161 RepID=A0A914XGG7_9BILA
MDLSQLGFGEKLVLLSVYCYILFKFLNIYIAIVIVIGTFTIIYLHLKEQSEYWKRHGIDGPEGNILFGNNLELRKGFGVIDTEWTKKYGKVFGTIIFGQPDLVVSDLEIMRRVLAKDFSNFTNHR